MSQRHRKDPCTGGRVDHMDPLKKLAPEASEVPVRQKQMVMAHWAPPSRLKGLIAVATIIGGGPACIWSKRRMAELHSDGPTGD